MLRVRLGTAKSSDGKKTMTEFLGVILFCATMEADTCQVLTSPTVFVSEEECLQATFNFYSFLGQKYAPMQMTPMCVELKKNGEPT